MYQIWQMYITTSKMTTIFNVFDVVCVYDFIHFWSGQVSSSLWSIVRKLKTYTYKQISKHRSIDAWQVHLLSWTGHQIIKLIIFCLSQVSDCCSMRWRALHAGMVDPHLLQSQPLLFSHFPLSISFFSSILPKSQSCIKSRQQGLQVVWICNF